MSVLAYGASLTVNAENAHALNMAGKVVGVQAMGGTALCDRVPFMAGDRKRHHPDTVVIAFLGNAATPCVATEERGRRRRHGELPTGAESRRESDAAGKSDADPNGSSEPRPCARRSR